MILLVKHSTSYPGFEAEMSSLSCVRLPGLAPAHYYGTWTCPSSLSILCFSYSEYSTQSVNTGIPAGSYSWQVTGQLDEKKMALILNERSIKVWRRDQRGTLGRGTLKPGTLWRVISHETPQRPKKTLSTFEPGENINNADNVEVHFRIYLRK